MELDVRPKIRVAVVESDPLRLVGLQSIFDSEPEIGLRAATLEDLIREKTDEVILLGAHKNSDHLEAIARLKEAQPAVRVIVTGAGRREEVILQAITAGAKGFVDEAADVGEFKQAIRMVNSGSVWAPGRVISKFIERVTAAPPPIPPPPRKLFTGREMEVLRMIVDSYSNTDIAVRLGISERMVKAHVGSLMRKAKADTRIALTVFAMNHGLVEQTYPSTYVRRHMTR